MPIIAEGNVFNVCGFDLPALDRWSTSVEIEVDLLHPKIPAQFREDLFKIAYAQYADPKTMKVDFRKLYDQLTDKKEFSELSPRITDYLLNEIRELVSIDDAIKKGYVMVKAKGPSGQFELHGGNKNHRHNAFIKRMMLKLGKSAVTVQDCIANGITVTEINDNIIPGYVENPSRNKQGHITGGVLVIYDGFPTFDWSKLGSRELIVNNHASKVILHKRLDTRMELHNKLVRNDPTLTAKERTDYKDRIGLGLKHFEGWIGKEIPRHRHDRTAGDGFIRKISWRGSKKTVPDDVETGVENIPTMLLKRRGKKKTHSLSKLFTNSRQKYRDYLRAQGIENTLESEYLIPEEFMTLKGGKEKEMGIVFRPNRRVSGLRQIEITHNEKIKASTSKKTDPTIPPPVIDYYFDSEERVLYVANIIDSNRDLVVLTLPATDKKNAEDRIVERLEELETYGFCDLSNVDAVDLAKNYTKKAGKSRFIPVKDHVIKDNGSITNIARAIPAHAIDIFDIDLRKDQRLINETLERIEDLERLRSGADAPTITKIDGLINDEKQKLDAITADQFSGKDADALRRKGNLSGGGEWLKPPEWSLYLMDGDGKYKSDLRPPLDPAYEFDFRFEEILIGLYNPLFKVSIEELTDERTGEFYWQYKTHEDEFDDITSYIVIIRNEIIDTETISRIQSLLKHQVFGKTGETFFASFIENSLDPYYEKVMNRLPELSYHVYTKLLNAGIDKEPVDVLHQKMEAIESDEDPVTKQYTKGNYSDLRSKLPRLIEKFKGYIRTSYPHAVLAVQDQPGFYYTSPIPAGILVEDEPKDIKAIRIEAEKRLKFLEFAYYLLRRDFLMPEEKREWVFDRGITKTRDRVPTIPDMSKRERESFAKDLVKFINHLSDKSYVSKEMDVDTHYKTMANEMEMIAHKRTSILKNNPDRWGWNDMHMQGGDMMVYLSDIYRVMAHSKKLDEDTNAKGEKFLDILSNAEDKTDASTPVDMMLWVELDDEETAEEILQMLKYYYDIDDIELNDLDFRKGVLTATIEEEIAENRHSLVIKKDIDKIIEETIDYFIDPDEYENHFTEAAEGEYQITEDSPLYKDPASGEKGLLNLNFTEDVDEARVINVLLRLNRKRVDVVEVIREAGEEDLDSLMADELLPRIKDALAGAKFKGRSISNILIEEKAELEATATIKVVIDEIPGLDPKELDALRAEVKDLLGKDAMLNDYTIKVVFSQEIEYVAELD